MATYKVIQDIEAEDKLLGPLTLRQFIYGAIAVINLYLCYFFAAHHAGFMIAVFLPVALATGFFAFPWGRDQPTELWALAKIRFALKPRRRIWDQSGIKELVTITAPKQTQHNYTNGLSETEVKSRLHALADTIDSRGWAIKNANLNLYGQNPLVLADPGSDRLIAPSALPQPVDSSDVQASDDILDEHNNADAQRLDSMIHQSAQKHRQQLMQDLQNPQQAKPAPANYWFLNQPSAPANIPNNMVTFNTQVVTPGVVPTADAGLPTPAAPGVDEADLMAQLDAHKQQTGKSHLHTIQPLSAQPAMPAPPPVQTAAMPFPSAPMPPAAIAPPAQSPAAKPPATPAKQAMLRELANNNDLNVATLAREAKRSDEGEVVIKLH